MKHVAKRKAELMIASHNQKSVEMAVQAMADYGISQNQPGYFPLYILIPDLYHESR